MTYGNIVAELGFHVKLPLTELFRFKVLELDGDVDDTTNVTVPVNGATGKLYAIDTVLPIELLTGAVSEGVGVIVRNNTFNMVIDEYVAPVVEGLKYAS